MKVQTWKRLAKRATIGSFVALALQACGSGDEASGGAVATSPTVTIKRDNFGVPHVYASEVKGLFYGYGYAVAEDRLFQMEMARRSVLGTAAEVLGPNFVVLDKSSRATFDPQSIKQQLAKLSQVDRDIFEGYALGFNAYMAVVLADKANLLPKQFVDAGFEPQPWTDFDVAMIWVGTMANRFSNGNSEVSNLQLLQQLKTGRGDAVGQQLFDQMRWLEDTKAPTTVPRNVALAQNSTASWSSMFAQLVERFSTEIQATLVAGGLIAPKTAGHTQLAQLAPVSPAVFVSTHAADAARRGIAAPEERPVASNLWITGPKKTTDGSTILINGPQFGWVNPAYVYGVGLHGAGYDVTGNTPFAHPAVLFGTNGKISWGATAGPLDVNDTYQERLNPANPNEYFFDGMYRPMTKTTEVIKVKGGADQSLDIYATVHGRVTSVDAASNSAYSLKRSWDGYEIESLLGWTHAMKAKSWDEFLTQAKRVAITINWYYADAAGNIGYVSPGRLPKRPSNQDVRLPALGDGSMEWQGIRPFTDNPQVYNPADGYIANWNNQSAPGMLADGGNYAAADRVNELRTRLDAKIKLTPDEIWALNQTASFADLNARYFVPYIVNATKNLASSDPLYQAAQTLTNWNMLNKSTGDTGFYDGSAPTILRAWLPNMYRLVLQDDLPAAVYTRYSTTGYPGATTQVSTNVSPATKVLYNALRGTQSGVAQTYDFFNGQDKDVVIRAALTDTLAQLTATYTADQSKWLTPATKHGFVPTNFIGYPQADASEVLSLPTYMNRGTENNKVIFDAQGAVSLCTVAPPGQSGFVSPAGGKSKHYSDQLSVYQTFGCKPEALTEKAVDSDRESSITLKY